MCCQNPARTENRKTERQDGKVKCIVPSGEYGSYGKSDQHTLVVETCFGES